jgi:two-component system phosphate regulon sensor histidine kinase PhoR
MREGLVVLNARGMILSINKSARRLFRAGANSEGRHFMTLDRSLQLQTAVEQASSGVPAEAQMTLRGRDYQLLTSPVRERGAVTGIVALVLDVTEQQAQERMRREFSANVSHELKTPLTSIPATRSSL